jgi:hypothetical protein
VEKPKDIIDFFSQMLAKREYLIPLIAAQYQFPNHYYGLTSAALLEDLFVDATINFKNQEFPDLQMERPERTTDENLTTDAKGEKGWDYKYEGQNYSHKVGAKIQNIALLWDATFVLPEDETYSYPSPIVMVLSNYKNKNANLILAQDKKIQVTPISNYRNKTLKSGQSIVIGRRVKGNSWELLEAIEVANDETKVNEILNLDNVWKKMTKYWSSNNPANSIEIFVTKNSKNSQLMQNSIVNKTQVEIDYIALPGVYLFPKSSLQNVKVTKNNRAILLPTEKVLEMVKLAFDSENFTYLPNWYSCYATSRSVDLYLVQRTEYDRLNSSARN